MSITLSTAAAGLCPISKRSTLPVVMSPRSVHHLTSSLLGGTNSLNANSPHLKAKLLNPLSYNIFTIAAQIGVGNGPIHDVSPLKLYGLFINTL